MGEFAAFIERSKAKSVSASGGLRPLTPRPGALPLDLAGVSPRPPLYRLALCALAMSPLCQILNAPLDVMARRRWKTPCVWSWRLLTTSRPTVSYPSDSWASCNAVAECDGRTDGRLDDS